MKLFCRWLMVVAVWFAAGSVRADEPPEQRELKSLVERQRVLLEKAETKQSQVELEDMRNDFQALVNDYEDYLRKNPKVAAGYVSYALLLSKPPIEERKRAASLLLKANEIDKDIPVVKNQLGNYLAEEGKPLEALNYFLSAVKLAPKEPLYHFQIGTLLAEARDDFLKSGEWTRAAIDKSMHDAFEQAMVLSPGNVEYAYRYAESFYDLDLPEWADALEVWRALETKVSTPIEKQTVRLHQANVLMKQGKLDEAGALIATVDQPVLQRQKQKLLENFPGAARPAGAAPKAADAPPAPAPESGK